MKHGNQNKYFVYAHGEWEESGHLVAIVSAMNAEDALDQIWQKTKGDRPYALFNFPRVFVVLLSELPNDFTGNQLTLRENAVVNPYFGKTS